MHCQYFIPISHIGLVQEPAGSHTSLAEFAEIGGKFRYFPGDVACETEVSQATLLNIIGPKLNNPNIQPI
jgi:hypothetical protein